MGRTTGAVLPLMHESLPQRTDKLYERVRLSLVSHLPQSEQYALLERAYGNWKEAGVLPRCPDAAQKILTELTLTKYADPVAREEYRRLENALGYTRRVFCLDMDGLLIEANKPVPNMKEAVSRLRKRHAVVVATAAPEAEASDMLDQAGFNNIAVFGDVGTTPGKNYLPIAQHFGYAWPEKRLVAISHSLEDIPADINIPFLYLHVAHEDLAGALNAGVNYLEGAPTIKFRVDKHTTHLEITKS